MNLSQKCQYALRALYEFSKRRHEGWLRVSEVAEHQNISTRFLENILNQLRQGGFVESKRGKEGGYALKRTAEEISVGDIIRYIDGPLHPLKSKRDKEKIIHCDFDGSKAFASLWNEAEKSLESIYNKSLHEMVELENTLSASQANDYCI